jgi:hypothetical protein
MTAEQAYIEGFVKRASEYGFNSEQAKELHDTTKNIMSGTDEMLRRAAGGHTTPTSKPQSKGPLKGALEAIKKIFRKK